MSRENHDELNEEALAYQIVWQSWGSTAAPLGGSDPDSDINPDHKISIGAPWQRVVG